MLNIPIFRAAWAHLHYTMPSSEGVYKPLVEREWIGGTFLPLANQFQWEQEIFDSANGANSMFEVWKFTCITTQTKRRSTKFSRRLPMKLLATILHYQSNTYSLLSGSDPDSMLNCIRSFDYPSESFGKS